MRQVGIPLVCAALLLTTSAPQCRADSRSYGPQLPDALGLIIVAGALIAVGGAAGIYNSAQRAHNRHHFKPGLNLKSAREIGHGKTFDVKVSVANAKAKPQKEWWDDGREPQITIESVDGVPGATLIKTEVKREWHISRYRALEPGLYRLTVKAPVPAPTAGAGNPAASGDSPTATATSTTVTAEVFQNLVVK